ncbi:KH domain-containing protein HEN4 [Senna tora]|uniref:KH domain-containing protein HEN4 n=1 Tax=Senna tora TaxID=362788 RepID=A0A834TG34_9FABA|nr:KH domain-containing protein HEN4 [Senna tora]
MTGHRSSYGKRSHSQSDYDNGGNKRRNPGDERDQFIIDPEDTVYRYLCPVRKIGSVIGRGGEIVKQLRVDTKSKIRIGETVPGCDERVITIYSPSDETNPFEDSGNYVSPAQDALFKVHERVVVDELHGDHDSEGGHQVTAKLLVPSDQIGCVIGKGGQIVQSIRSDTGAQIRILKDDHLPPCALNSDELVQISGDPAIVKKALYQISSRLHDNPSRSQSLLASAVPGVYPTGGSLVGPTAGAPIVGIAPLVSHYGGYKGDSGDWSRSLYSAPRDEGPSKEFSVRLVCPTGNIGGVIGKGGAIINQIRQDSGATIKVDSSSTEADDCLIAISTKEFFDETFSPTIEAAVRLQPRCSEKVERDSGIISFTTRLLVPTSRIGCLIGKGGSIITEMRRLTKANIRILSKENLPKIASEDDEMVQISGDLDLAKDALVQVLTRLRANIFDREGAVSAFLPVLPYLPVPSDGSDGLNYDSRDSKRHGRGHSFSSGYGGPSDLAAGDGYGSYNGSQLGGSSAYGAYGSYSLGRTSFLVRTMFLGGETMLTKTYWWKQLNYVKPEACLLFKPEDQMNQGLTNSWPTLTLLLRGPNKCGDY